MIYKVAKEEGIVLDGVDFAVGEFVEPQEGSVEAEALIADGSLVPETDEEKEEVVVEDETDEAVVSEGDGAVTPVLTYEGKPVTGEVTDSEVDGVAYKSFSVDGQTYKLTAEQFGNEVTLA